MTKISVLGSINLDTTLHINHIPLPGETLHVSEKSSAAGGKELIKQLALKEVVHKLALLEQLD